MIFVLKAREKKFRSNISDVLFALQQKKQKSRKMKKKTIRTYIITLRNFIMTFSS